jgi:indole-3-glycerol phosphate synthase
VLIAEHHHDEGTELEENYARALGLGLECVIDVRNEEELELALERVDPEIFLLSPREADDGEEALDRVLELLPDVPAGKLAIAELPASTREDVASLERAGVDAVLVGGGDVAHLVGVTAPEV